MGIFQNPTVLGVLAFIFILGAAVTLHEFGHFLVAKLLKIRVETFSFGFGPRLLGRKIGTTDYRISLIPLGGYVKLGGDESNAPIEGEGASDIPANERFDLRPRWQRILVAVAGPVMNVLTALSIPFAGAMIYGVQAPPPPVVRQVAPGGAAEAAGLQPGDRIVVFDGNQNPKWRTIADDALLSPGQPIPLEVERNGQRLKLTIKPTPHTEEGETAGFLDFLPDYGNVPIVVREVVPNSPAAEAGLRVGDRIVAVNGEPVKSAEQVTQTIREHKGQPITLRAERDGRPVEISATPRLLNPQETRERLGFTPDEEIPYQRVGIAGSFATAVDTNYEFIRVTGKALGQLFAGKRSVRNTISGPIGIYRAASTSAIRLGWAGVFSMLGFLSLNLGVFNLLPIPVLDGGAIFLLLIEGLLATVGMKISMTVRERIQQVGFVVVILLMVFVITNDLLKSTASWRGGDTPPASSSPVPATPSPAK
ncbi:MAG: regulator of sigma protease [Blastocatellia bacterium]|jgi:regulator of sigma E protease|nr:regulator of sigma protease [Blastocatellia bacterium]